MCEKLNDDCNEIAKNSCYFWAEYISEYDEEEDLRFKLNIIKKYLSKMFKNTYIHIVINIIFINIFYLYNRYFGTWYDQRIKIYRRGLN